jgi:predicted nucleic acid-binding protein
MKVLLDSSVWAAYFRGTGHLATVDLLIEEGLVVINDLILTELMPPLLVRGERKLIALLNAIERPPLALDWAGLVNLRVLCIRNGLNKVGLPDLIIAQHAMQHNLVLFSLDKHFSLLSSLVPLKLQ